MMCQSGKSKFIVIVIIFFLIGFIYGSIQEKRNQRPSGIFELFTVPYRALRWIKHNEPVTIPEVPKDSLHYFYGSRIQRTMTLLETSNEKKRNRVKILFYGQSIMERIDSESIINKLQERYPFAIIEYDNLSIGGFFAQRLVRTAVHDLYPYYPELLILHVYVGDTNEELERIIYNTRKYTTSEIMILNHHYSWNPDSVEFKNQIELENNESNYINFLAQKYGCELVDVRNEWSNYIKEHENIDFQTLIGDRKSANVHPNKEGNKLLELLILKHFRYNTISTDPSRIGWFSSVRKYEAKRFLEERFDEIGFEGNARQYKNAVVLDSGQINLAFKGNKVELHTLISNDFHGEIEIFIDGKKPSEIQELYYCTRPTLAFEHFWPAIKRISLHSDPLPERWKLVITSIDHKLKHFEFKVYGEKTGFDGRGDNQCDFISNSKRIAIDHSDFMIFESDNYTGENTPTNFQINWEVKPLFMNKVHYSNKDSIFVLAQGLDNSSHVLTMENFGSGNGFPIKSIVVFSPPISN